MFGTGTIRYLTNSLRFREAPSVPVQQPQELKDPILGPFCRFFMDYLQHFGT